MKSDPFGFKEQGINYHCYRPDFPTAWLQAVNSRIIRRHRMIDIGTGTGKLLIHFAPSFSHAVGLDRSVKMVETLRQVLNKYSLSHVEVEQNCIKDYTSVHRFDFVVIGQALHFMPIEHTLFLSSHLLSQDGILAVGGYYLDSVDGPLNFLFQSFYSKIKPCFDFDRDDLHSHYRNEIKYPFEKIFASVERETFKEKIVMNKQAMIGYLKTISGYHRYLERFNEDPLAPIESSEFESISCHFEYFLILAKQPKLPLE